MKIYIPFFALGFLIFTACSSSTDDCEAGPVEYPNQQGEIDGTVYRNSLMDCRLPKVQSFEFNSYQGAQIVASQGTALNISPNIFFDLDGNPIDGRISFSILEMYDPGDIVACQLSTNGLNSAQQIEPLLSESIFYIEAYHNGNPVRMEGEMEVFIPSEVSNLQLSLFHSPTCSQLQCSVLWEEIPRRVVNAGEYVDAAGNIITGYRSVVTGLGWFSFARYNSSAAPRGILYNKALAPYNLGNSNVFIKYEGNSTAIGMYSEFDANSQVFSEKYGQIPADIPSHVIFVGKPGNSFNFKAAGLITENGKITVTRQLQSGSETELVDYVNNL